MTGAFEVNQKGDVEGPGKVFIHQGAKPHLALGVGQRQFADAISDPSLSAATIGSFAVERMRRSVLPGQSMGWPDETGGRQFLQLCSNADDQAVHVCVSMRRVKTNTRFSKM